MRNNNIQSTDHILNRDLVCEHPAAANFVGMVEQNMQEIKEEFNEEVLTISGSNIGKDNEVLRRRHKWKNDTRVLLDSERNLILWLRSIVM